MKRNEWGACLSWWDPFGDGYCGHCGKPQRSHDPPEDAPVSMCYDCDFEHAAGWCWTWFKAPL